MKRHTDAIHDGKKDYKCVYCARSFSRPDTLKQHVNTFHNDYKNYKCESCGKSFSQASNLKIHIHTIHEGRKNYICKLCSKSFSQAHTATVANSAKNCLARFQTKVLHTAMGRPSPIQIHY